MEKKRSLSEPSARELKRSAKGHTTKKIQSRSSGEITMKRTKTKSQSELVEDTKKKEKNESQSDRELQEKAESQLEGVESSKKKKTTESQSEVEDSTNVEAISDPAELTYAQKVANAVITAKPMASRKLAKKCYKIIKKAAKHKNYLRKGFKDVQKYLCQCGKRDRKGRAIVVFAGDITPIDVMIHLPAVCEQNNIPYCYVPCQTDLGAAAKIKRGSWMVVVKEKEDYKELFDELYEELKHLSVEL